MSSSGPGPSGEGQIVSCASSYNVTSQSEQHHTLSYSWSDLCNCQAQILVHLVRDKLCHVLPYTMLHLNQTGLIVNLWHGSVSSHDSWVGDTLHLNQSNITLCMKAGQIVKLQHGSVSSHDSQGWCIVSCAPSTSQCEQHRTLHESWSYCNC